MTATIQAVRRRCGGTVTGPLVLLSLLGAALVSAVVVGPRLGHGATERNRSAILPAPAPAGRQNHRELMGHFAGLIGRSAAVLAVHQRGATPYLEMVLWVEDQDGSGKAEPSEVVIVSHSRVMQTVTLFEWTAGSTPADGGIEIVRPVTPAFCNAWRADWHVRPQVILTGVSDLSAQPLESLVAGRQRLRITLTWGGNSADGPDVVSADVDAAVAARDTWG